MSATKISVIILTYNRNQFVLNSVNSVLNQTFPEFELLIIDDGSSDDTLLNLARIKDPRVTILDLEHSGHIARLRNTGLQRTSGKYIAFLDSDDQWDKEHLSTQVNLIEADDSLGFVSSDMEVYAEQNLIFKGVYGSTTTGSSIDNFFQKVMSGQMILPAASTLLFRRKCLETTGYWNEKFITGDFEFSCRLACHFNGIRCTDLPAKIYRHSANHSDLWELYYFREVISTLQQFYDSGRISRSLYKERCFDLHYKMGIKFWQRKKRLNAIKEFLSSYRMKPVHFKTIVQNVHRLFN